MFQMSKPRKILAGTLSLILASSPLPSYGGPFQESHMDDKVGLATGVGVSLATSCPEFYQKAIDQGIDWAQFNLGWMYENGVGVPQDTRKAAELYQKAADQGFARAQFNLGWMHQYGVGVPQDIWKAAEFYQKAVDQGFVGAQTYLALIQKYGVGLDKDISKAVKLYQ